MELLISISLIAIIAIIYILVQIKNINHIKNDLQIAQNEINEKNLHINTLENKIIYQTQNNHTLENEIKEIQNSLEDTKNKANSFESTIGKLETQLELEQKHRKQSETTLQEQFKNLANDILEGNSKKLSHQNKEALALILTPMQEQIKDFKKKIEDVYDKESSQRNFLQAELKTLKELNTQISNDAINLTNALKGEKKKQGVWGEMVLENVLENSGLREGYEYAREVNLKDENNKNFRPDVIVKLPNERDIIIDAKTSLNSYNEYYSCENIEEKDLHLKKHIIAIKEHIKSLSNKKYEHLEGINSLDFIFMFIPIEAALLLALENDPNIYDDAFKQKIILVSPTTLLVALRAVENSWRYEKQAQNIVDVAKRAELLYSKFNGFVDDMSAVENALNKANETHKKAFDKLKFGPGNLISQATLLKKVSNIKPKKELKPDLVQNALESSDD